MRRHTTLALLLLIVLPLHEGAAADDHTNLSRATTAVDAAKTHLSARRSSREILAALEEAASAMAALRPPPKPELLPSEPDAPAMEASRIAAENARRLKAWAKARGAFDRKAARLRAAWVKVLADAVALARIHKVSETNLHDEVNRWALGRLVATGHPDVPGAIIRVMDRSILRTERRYVSERLIVEIFEALPALGSTEILEWLRRGILTHPREAGAGMPLRVPAQGGVVLRAANVPGLALFAVARHEGVPGAVRYELVRDLIAVYAPMEARALRGVSRKPWESLGDAAIRATWRQAGEPVDAAGAPLSTMRDLGAWFHEHRDPHADPWRD